MPQLSKGGGKQGQPSVLHASPDALKSWQNSRFFVPEAVLSSDQREGLLPGKQIPPKQRCSQQAGRGHGAALRGFRCTSVAKVMGRINLSDGKIFPPLTVGFSSPHVVNATYKHIPGF